MSRTEAQNPFQYQTPESIKTDDALSIFVDVFKDFYHVINNGNTFIHGPRGSGKSMMFRIMKSDCQIKKLGIGLSELPFYAIHIPVKDTSLRITDIDKLEKNYGAIYLNEHFMVLYFSICLFDTLAKEDFSRYDTAKHEAIEFYKNVLLKRFKLAGWSEYLHERSDFTSANQVFEEARNICAEMQSAFTRNFIVKISLNPTVITYEGPLCLYSDFLLPIVKEIRMFTFIPSSPLYFMVDDADELNLTQTQILNSWVSFRSTSDICYKVSTQLKYKTFFASTGSKIDAPHDFYEIDLTEAYTSDHKEKYNRNVKAIIEKRLDVMGGLKITAENYFPEDEKQAKEIASLKSTLIKQQKESGKEDKAAYDYAYRYATSEYIKILEKTGEGHGHNYSYAGFTSLVHLSSNIIRNFLDLASKMYVSTYNNITEPVEFIPVNIQNAQIEEYSSWFLESNFERIISDQRLDKQQLTHHKKLYNLIDSLGQAFSRFFKSDLSERRMFSFYFEDEPSNEVECVLKIGVSTGYFHRSSKSNKTGTGRAKLYVINRMLAPLYRLDPVSFSGYLFLKADKLELAMNNQKEFLKYIEDRIGKGNKEQDDSQLKLDLN